jgi:AP-3 complex subunit delta-1
MRRRTFTDFIKAYLTARSQGNDQNFVVDVISKMQDELRGRSPDDKMDAVQQLIFLNLRGHDTTWADFWVLEVMTIDSYEAKRIAYTAASRLWTQSSDVVLMATNRIQHDLTSLKPLLPSLVLATIPAFLSQGLAHDIASDVIAMMSAAKPVIRQKAIVTFYHICLRYPDALRPGFSPLRSRLDDPDISVVFAALAVMSELCGHNVQNFLPMIPKFHSMLESSAFNWVTIRLIYLLRMLCVAEPRLQKKLVGPFTTILETTVSPTVLFEVVRTIIDIPSTNTVLLTTATQRMETFLEHEDNNLRFLCLSLFIKLIEIQPRIVALHKDLITRCLDSSDEATRVLALDLLAALANGRTIDGIVARMFKHFKSSKSQVFKDQILRRVVEICSQKDYDLVSDFEWYISVLMDFLHEGGFTCYDVLGDQFLDMALRVPDTRPRLVAEMARLFENVSCKDATSLLLAASHVIAEYSTDADQFEHVMQPLVTNTDERVQTSAILSSFRLFLRSEQVGEAFVNKLSLFETSPFAEVQDCAALMRRLLGIVNRSKDGKAIAQFRASLVKGEESFEPIERPAELDEPIALFRPESKDEPELEIIPIRSGRPERLKPRPVKGSEFRRQNEKASKPKILKLAAEKPVAPPRPKTAPVVLSPELASVDLTEIIAEDEVKNLPRPMPYVQTELMKQQQNRQRHKHKAAPEPKLKPPTTNPVTGPKPHSRAQPLGDNSCMLINANEFFCAQDQPNSLEVEFTIQNQSNAVLTAIDASAESLGSNRITGNASYSGAISPGDRATFRMTLTVADIRTPEKAKVVFAPTSGGETLEARILIFSSFFLLPGDPAQFDDAKAKAAYVEKLGPTSGIKPKDLLQCVFNVLRGTMLKTSDPHARTLYSRSTQKDDVICNMQIQVAAVFIELKASNWALAKSLIREVNWRIKSLAA